MASSMRRQRRLIGISVGVAVTTVFAMMLAGAVLVAPAHSAGAHLAVTPASGSTEQWAFGGNASVSWSCTTPAQCFGAGSTAGFSSASLSLSYSIVWAVIYTQTNVSATQTMEEIQAGISATASFSFSECYSDNSTPCQTLSAGLNLNGKEYGVGFTNISSTGSVYLTPTSGTPGDAPADAILNGASSELYNFSGNYNLNSPTEDGSPPLTESASFVLGGNESSGIDFATPLGFVPINPQPGDNWSSNASYSAHGGYTSGFSLTLSQDGVSETNGTWSSAAVTPSGQLYENGTDLGSYPLTDNYTGQTVTVQEILISFGSGDEFSAADGWVLIPVGVFGDIVGILSHPESGIAPALTSPLQGLGSLTSSETTYYQSGKGFVGTNLATGAIAVPVGSGASTPSVQVTAGPEPVSVAQGQYNGILSGSGSSASFPWSWLIIGVVVVVVVVIVAVLVVMRGRHRPPPPIAQYGMPGAPPSIPPMAPPPRGPGDP